MAVQQEKVKPKKFFFLTTTTRSTEAEPDGRQDGTIQIPDPLKRACERRGPDSQRSVEYQTEFHSVLLHASVLSLRGPIEVTTQPIISADGRLIFAWNGQIFRHLVKGTDDEQSPLLDPQQNDGAALLATVESALFNAVDPAEANQVVQEVFSKIEGPFAFVLLDTKNVRLYFGRDTLGRRSLLMRNIVEQTHDGNQSLLLCSLAEAATIATGSSLVEVDCSSFWTVDLTAKSLEDPKALARDNERLQLSDASDANTVPESVPTTARLTAAHTFRRVLEDSVRRRVTGIRPYTESTSAHVAVLFSGGLDCATVALLAHHCMDPAQPIDLLNVALENPRSIQAATRAAGGSKQVDPYNVPDRQTGIATYDELRAMAPNRKWNFVQVNVPYAEYCEAKEEIRSTMYPSNSVMDLSIAAALYFAARGSGKLLSNDKTYETSARILLSGLGADELLGGYSRHRVAFQKGGKSSLVQELQLDLDRLPTRNLGRDDRILSTHAKETRYPFLDRKVLEHLCSLRVEDKMNFEIESSGQQDPTVNPPLEGLSRCYPGDKLLLRIVAGELLGLTGAAQLKKRAIQFGSRSAKMEIEPRGGRIKGHEELGA
ncbi:hypothetical protein OC846_005095 [Tilletia horrida]|uniref:Glutamine amidotransferase type-2 domain-containing protein n=1 Tax=Tilletia horrida TaxID=155126 RepID=A0AAN6GM00_9BASI|nr:hypothetical protein OC846_005095 [Tilletia horrida]